MSVIIKDSNDQYFMFIKGADQIILDLSPGYQPYLE